MRTLVVSSFVASLVGFVACAGSSRSAERTNVPEPAPQADAQPPADGSPSAEEDAAIDEAIAQAKADEMQAAYEDVDAQGQDADAEQDDASQADARQADAQQAAQRADDESEDEDPLAALVGEYRYAGGRDRITDAIDDVVDEMSVFARGIARDRLTEANDAPKRISISADGDEVTVKIDDETFTAKVDGKAVRVPNSEGGTSRMRFRLRGTSLVQIFDAESGDRINVFTPRRGGKALTLHVTMKSSRLPKDVKYRLAYR